MIRWVGMRARKIVIWAFNSLSCALCRGMKNWFRKARRRDMVELILPGSTTAFKKCRSVNMMGLAYILAPLSGKQKMPGQLRAAIEPGQGACQGL